MIWKESSDKRRDGIKNNLRASASRYADHVEIRISKLQQAYASKYHPWQHVNVSQSSQDGPNNTFQGRLSSIFRRGREHQWEIGPVRGSLSEGLTDVNRVFQLDPLNQSSALVTDDDCREAVANLNKLRLSRAEDLESGYDVSDIHDLY